MLVTGEPLYDVEGKQPSPSKGIKLDGAYHPQFVLEPGVEIGIGGATLVAESLRWTKFREYLTRLLGWRAERIKVIDHALRSIRMAVTRRAALVLLDDGDLVSIARALHRRTLGADLPFIVCKPRRRQRRGDVRSAENYALGLPALAAVSGGSLCVRSFRLPKDFGAVLAEFRARAAPPPRRGASSVGSETVRASERATRGRALSLTN